MLPFALDVAADWRALNLAADSQWQAVQANETFRVLLTVALALTVHRRDRGVVQAVLRSAAFDHHVALIQSHSGFAGDEALRRLEKRAMMSGLTPSISNPCAVCRVS